MVTVSITLNRIHYPTPYNFKRIAEYIVVAIVLFFISETIAIEQIAIKYIVNTLILAVYLCYAVRREKIDVVALVKAMIRR